MNINTQVKELNIDELLKRVKPIWLQVSKQYLAGIAETTINKFEDTSIGLNFHLDLPKTRIHHFTVDVRAIKCDFDITDDASLRSSILKVISTVLLEKVGSWQIEEAKNPTFCMQNQYGYRELEALHEDEDKILEAGQTMFLASNFIEFASSFNSKYGYLPAFTNSEISIIKSISKLLVKKTNLIVEKIAFKGFKSAYLKKQAQLAVITLASPKSNKQMSINIFVNQVRQYEDKFARKGFGKDQAIYFIIRTYLKQKILNLQNVVNISEAEIDGLYENLEVLPKYIVDLVKNKVISEE